jgi:nucleotide-binding universal stress UspA family protein
MGGVVVSPLDWVRSRSPEVRRAFAQTFQRVADDARQALAAQWPEAEVVTTTGRPADSILRAARRLRADVIVIGWRGHGAFRQVLMGSVSRQVVERARAAVLVVRRPMREVRRVVIGVDGSPNARRAVELVARLPHARLDVTVVRVVEPRTVLTAGRLPESIRSIVLHELAVLNDKMVREARQEVEAATSRLKRAGGKARGQVWQGTPLPALLEAVDRTDANLLVVGARAASGVKRALLGSVAAGVLNRSSVPVLVVR